jgi:hypothetical protein
MVLLSPVSTVAQSVLYYNIFKTESEESLFVAVIVTRSHLNLTDLHSTDPKSCTMIVDSVPVRLSLIIKL